MSGGRPTIDVAPMAGGWSHPWPGIAELTEALSAGSWTLVADSRDRDRHLFDAAALLACIDDPFAERETFTGSDRRRIDGLRDSLGPAHPAWRALPGAHRDQAQLTLGILSAPPARPGTIGG